MKGSLFRLLTACIAIAFVSVFATTVLAQGKGGGNGGGKGGGGEDPPTAGVRYRAHWILGPAEATNILPRDIVIRTDEFGTPTKVLVIGYYFRSDRTSTAGFVYEMQNPGDPSDSVSNRFWDIEELVGPTPSGIPWATTNEPLSTFRSRFAGVNSAGLVSGHVEDPAGVRNAVYLDLNQNPLDLVVIPPPQVPYQRYYGSDVTEAGDILVRYDPDNATPEGYVFHSSTDDVTPICEPATSDPTTCTPISFAATSSSMQLSMLGDVVGQRADDMVIRHSLVTGETVEFPDLLWAPDINDSGQFPSIAEVLVSTKGKGKWGWRYVRIGADNSIQWHSERSTGWAGFNGYSRINNQGDVLMDGVTYYHDRLDVELNVADLVIPESDPDSWFRYVDDRGNMSDVDATDFSWLLFRIADVPQADGSTRSFMAILIPEIGP